MDSASPIANRTAGENSFVTGTTFTFAMRTINAEKPATRPLLDDPSGYRDGHRRSHGEGPPA